MQRVLLFVVVPAGVLAASAGTVEACECLAPRLPACQSYAGKTVAFVGRAIDVPPGAGGIVKFQVRRSVKGFQGSEVSVLNQESSLGCGYPFESGREYAVFASRNKAGDIEIGACSTTIWRTDLATSASTMAFIASLDRPATGGRIYGEVELASAPAMSLARRMTPVTGTTVILRGGGQERRTTTVKGRYEFPGLAPGTYRVSVSMPKGLPAARRAGFPSSGSLTLPDSRSCGYAPFEAGPR